MKCGWRLSETVQFTHKLPSSAGYFAGPQRKDMRYSARRPRRLRILPYEGRNWSSSWREALSAMPPRAIGWPCIVPTAMPSGQTAVQVTRPEGVGSRYVCSSTPEV